MPKDIFSWSVFSLSIYKEQPLGPCLSVNETWPKRSDHPPKSGCADLKNVYSKRVNLGFFFMFNLLPSSFLVTMEMFAPQKRID